MPCFYSSEIIAQALTMLSWQTKKDEIEVILINDCSPNTDCDYQDLLEQFSDILNIKYLKTEKNLGPGGARQLGIENCDCPWVFFHDDDDIINNPYVIEEYLNIIEKIPEDRVYSIGGDQLLFPNPTEYFKRLTIGFTGRLYNLNLIKKFNISFKNLRYEEDRYFITEYLYYYFRNAAENNDIYYEISSDKENFITYTKRGNLNSICAILSEEDKCWEALKMINEIFTFYLSIPLDDISKNYIEINISDDFKYFQKYVIERCADKELTSEQKNFLLKTNKNFYTILNLYPDLNFNENLNFYQSFINKL